MKNVLLLLFVALCACSKQDKIENERSIEIDIESKNEVSIYDIFKRIEVIPLQTTEESLFREISKVIEYNNRYYILDATMSQLFVFDAAGNFLFKINNIGQGPEEYLSFSDFCIDTVSSTIKLLSPVEKKILLFDIKDASFKTSVKLPDIQGAYNKLSHLNVDTIVFWTSDYDNKIKLYSVGENKIVDNLFPEKHNIYNYFLSTDFFFAHNFARSSQNTVYKITEDGKLQEEYEWDFGKLNNKKIEMQNPPDILSENIMEYSKDIFASKVVNYIFIQQGRNQRILYTKLSRKDKLIDVFYNKQTKTSFVFEKTTENARLSPVFWANEYIIGSLMDGYSIDDTLPDLILDEENLKKKKNRNELDNPVLVKYYFKND